MARIAGSMTNFAKCWEFDGMASPENMRMVEMSRRVHQQSGAVVMFSRDSGHHTSGWMKNPDYERCLHLSLSPIPGAIVIPGRTIEMDERISRMWCEAFFRDDVRLAWRESAKSKMGKAVQVVHWRVFCNEHWEPIHPRGEVYSTELTEKGWKSASEVFELTGKPEPISTVDPS